MAIKLSRALDMSYEDFKKFNIENNARLSEAYKKNQNFKHEPHLPNPQIIFEKKYHFMDETLLEKQERKK